jgi:hypothetical protein
MNDLVEKLWPHIKVSTIIEIALIVGGAFLTYNFYVLGVYLLAGWLLSPLVSYWLMGNHNWPISFMIKMYPMFVRKFTLGWFLSLLILSYVWGFGLAHIKFS